MLYPVARMECYHLLDILYTLRFGCVYLNNPFVAVLSAQAIHVQYFNMLVCYHHATMFEIYQ